jgi:hypothetical protein
MKNELLDPKSPTGIKGVKKADLPALYRAAENALAAAKDKDEVKEWDNKAAALASYARQAKDRTLLNYANLIRNRAQRRMNDILKELPKGQRGPKNNFSPQRTKTRRDAEDDLGMTARERHQTKAIGEMDQSQFDAHNSPTAEKVPSPHALATLASRANGRASPKPSPQDPRSDESKMATKLLNLIDEFQHSRRSIRPLLAVKGMTPKELQLCRDQVQAERVWLGKVLEAIDEATPL